MERIKTINPSFNIQIWCGLREGYDGKEHSIESVEHICQQFVNKKGLCVTVTPTKFVYTDGNESGVVIGLIQYPRFPKKIDYLIEQSKEFAELLMNELGQNRVTITTPNESIMLENENKN